MAITSNKRYIIVEKLNEVYLKLEADADIRKNLSDYFSFEVPGYRFTPQYRNRVWDGRIRLYSYATGQLYVGLYPYLEHWCNEQKVERTHSRLPRRISELLRHRYTP